MVAWCSSYARYIFFVSELTSLGVARSAVFPVLNVVFTVVIFVRRGVSKGTKIFNLSGRATGKTQHCLRSSAAVPGDAEASRAFIPTRGHGATEGDKRLL